MKSHLIVGDIIVRIRGFKRLIGRRYKVLSITLTDTYIQDMQTDRCSNYSNRWIIEEFVKLNEGED